MCVFVGDGYALDLSYPLSVRRCRTVRCRGSLSEVTREFMCPIMKCGGTDTERPVLPIAGCHIYIHVFVCVCVCLCVYVCVCMRNHKAKALLARHRCLLHKKPRKTYSYLRIDAAAERDP